MRVAAFRIASKIGCTVEELDDRMTHAEFLQWCEYETWEEKRITKTDLYLARMTAMLMAQLNPKGQYYAEQYLIGRESEIPAGHQSLRDASSDEVKAMWRAALPFATYEGPKTNG